MGAANLPTERKDDFAYLIADDLLIIISKVDAVSGTAQINRGVEHEMVMRWRGYEYRVSGYVTEVNDQSEGVNGIERFHAAVALIMAILEPDGSLYDGEHRTIYVEADRLRRALNRMGNAWVMTSMVTEAQARLAKGRSR